SRPTQRGTVFSSVSNPHSNGESSRKTILVVDDNSASLNVFYWVLERRYNVLKAETANEAIALCQQHQHQLHLILADVFLRSPISGTQVGLEARTFCPDAAILLTSGTPIEGW